MSLVAYAYSSGEESEPEEEAIPVSNKEADAKPLNGFISDEDEFDHPVSHADDTQELQLPQPTRKLINLPAPSATVHTENDPEEKIVLAFDELPKPKPATDQNGIIEEDDEFLHKKESPSEEKPPPVVLRKGPVKITIPSLSQFKDLEKEKPSTSKPALAPAAKPSGLLGLLPRPKHELVLQKASQKPTTSSQSNPKPVTSLIPDSVKNKSSTKATPSTSKKIAVKKSLVSHGSDSEDSDGDGGDFFSLNSEHKLPEVSAHEINAMVAKRAAQMADAATRTKELLKSKAEEAVPSTQPEVDASYPSASQQPQVNFDDHAIKALVGSRGAKRQKMEKVNIVELSANEVLPNQDEWLRSALASSTSYQPRGVLVDEEPAPGTRRKHQITYLAHQAKANESELQAMWSANRHTRRQTQGKYGF